jgi:hypothetical protein
VREPEQRGHRLRLAGVGLPHEEGGGGVGEHRPGRLVPREVGRGLGGQADRHPALATRAAQGLQQAGGRLVGEQVVRLVDPDRRRGLPVQATVEDVVRQEVVGRGREPRGTADEVRHVEDHQGCLRRGARAVQGFEAPGQGLPQAVG